MKDFGTGFLHSDIPLFEQGDISSDETPDVNEPVLDSEIEPLDSEIEFSNERIETPYIGDVFADADIDPLDADEMLTEKISEGDDDFDIILDDFSPLQETMTADLERHSDDPEGMAEKDIDELMEMAEAYTEEQMDVIRENYRFKGWPDGPELEAVVMAYRPAVFEWCRNNLEGVTPNPPVDVNYTEYREKSEKQGVLYVSKNDENANIGINEDVELQDIENIDEWLGEINPNFDEFDPESPYCNNCGSCAYAVYQRLEGLNEDACASAENINYNDEMNALTGMEQVSMSPDEIETRLLEAGEGAHAIIGIDRAEGPGHWFNAACKDGKVVAIDGQTGEITEWPPDYGDVINWEMSVKLE